MIRTYYLLTKPGIIMGNLITTASGFLLASRGHFDPLLFLATLVGLGCVIASACVFNNYIDRESDKKMARTKNRPLARGIISGKRAMFFAIFLGIVGMAALAKYTNLLAVAVALVGFIVYVVLYSFWKHRSSSATLVGSISGAVPPVVGYCAVSGRVDVGAVLFFLILVLWQMPHFFAIGMYRFNDYKAAGVPILPVTKGIQNTKVQMVLYIIAFIIAASLLLVFGYTGYIYLAVAVSLGLVWLAMGFKGFKSVNDQVWARGMFRFSLVVIMALSVVISLDVVS
jgi:heme o synthase